MLELYSLAEVGKIFGLTSSRLRYWIQSGFLTPSVRRGGRYLYTFTDLIQVKAAVEMLAGGMSANEVRQALVELRDELPESVPPGVSLRVSCSGEGPSVTRDGHPEPVDEAALVCAFSTDKLREQVAEVCQTPAPALEPVAAPAPRPIAGSTTERHEQPSAFQCFSHACQAEAAGRDDLAEVYYERCLALEDGFAAVHTNLGNLYFRRGDNASARRAYERALELEPDQTEARYNLGNLLDEEGEIELAIAELRRVVARDPDFADAHFNLGVILARVGGLSQARRHFHLYLSLDNDSAWAERARDYLDALSEAPAACA